MDLPWGIFHFLSLEGSQNGGVVSVFHEPAVHEQDTWSDMYLWAPSAYHVSDPPLVSFVLCFDPVSGSSASTLYPYVHASEACVKEFD